MTGLIFLIGFRATGKTSVGERLAGKLGCRFIDTDQRICLKKGSSIKAIVEREGWEGFRRCEREVLEEVAQVSGCVVATGGGAVLHRDFWKGLRKGAAVIWLKAESGIVLQRICADAATADNRPSLSGKGFAEEIVEIMNEREPMYREFADYSVDTGRMTVDEAVGFIYAKIATLQD
jgi:shikimate kinase